METQLNTFGRVSGAVVALTLAGVANATAIFTVSTFIQQIGTKAVILRKLMVQNLAGGNNWLYIGTGVGGAFASLIPAVMVINNLDNEWQEIQLPRVQSIATVTAYPLAIAGGGAMNVQLEVEENG